MNGAVTVDVAFNFYRQKPAWRGGGGSPGLDDFSATTVIERDVEKHAGVVRGLLFGKGQLRTNVWRKIA